VAAWKLRFSGFRILARRYKTPVGEIDIVARRGKTLVFVEVKARQDLSTALQAVSPQMKNRIIRAANYFMARHSGFVGMDIRFDLIAVAAPWYWRHLDNVWRPSA